jgi:hypothetical protein
VERGPLARVSPPRVVLRLELDDSTAVEESPASSERVRRKE